MDGRRRLAEPVTDGAATRPAAGAAPGSRRARASCALRSALSRRPFARTAAPLVRTAADLADSARRRHRGRGCLSCWRASAYGAVRGGHLPSVIAELRDIARRRRQCGRLPHHLDRAGRPAPADPRRHPHHRRHHRPHLAAVPRRRRGAGAAQGQSLDRRSHRAQALSGPAAYRGDRARRLRALAARRQGRGDRRRRHRGRALQRRSPSPSCRWWSAWAPKPGPRIFWRCSTTIRDPRAAPRRRPGRRAALERHAQERHRRAPAGRRASSRRSTRWSSSTATRSC